MSHHDNRNRFWNVSLTDEEYEIAESLREKSGLSKAEFGRQALCHGTVICRVSDADRKEVARLHNLHASVNEIAKILQSVMKNQKGDSAESVAKLLYKFRDQINNIEESCATIGNYFSSKL